MTIQHRDIEYRDGDTVLQGYLTYDDSVSVPRPAIAIAHTWQGRSGFECDKATQLAKLGYVGFAIDMYGKGILGSGPEENAALMQPFMDDRGLLQRRITAALDILNAQPEVDSAKIAAMGFCFGGLCVLDLARTGVDIRGVASFHGLFAPPNNISGQPIRAKVLCLHGHDDPMVPVEAVNALASELTAAGTDWQIHAYGNTVHAFTNPAADFPDMGAVYNASADRRSWRSLVNFLEEIFE